MRVSLSVCIVCKARVHTTTTIFTYFITHPIAALYFDVKILLEFFATNFNNNVFSMSVFNIPTPHTL